MSAPGWYPDPNGGRQLRWFDGVRWTEATHGLPSPAPRRRKAIIGPLLILAGIVAGVILALRDPSVDIPLAGSHDCGASSVGIATGYDTFTPVANDTLGIAQSLQDECKGKAQHNMIIAIVVLVGGLIGGGIVSAMETS